MLGFLATWPSIPGVKLVSLSTFSHAWQQVTCFPAFGTGCMFSRAWHRFHVFPCLVQVACFPALGTGFMFSRAWHRLHVFPRLAQVSCFHALGTGSMGCFPLCQTDRSEISGNTWGKWNDIFRLNRATNRNGCCYFKFFYRIPKLGQRTSLSYFGRNILTEIIMWTTSKGDPEYSGQKKPKRTFPFEFRPKFSESLA